MALSFTSAVAKYFGRLPRQDMKGFRDEFVALTSKDKDELRGMLETALGETVEPYAG